MISRNLVNFLKYSGVWVGFVLNPYQWRFSITNGNESVLDDSLFELAIYAGPVWVRVVIDDGRW